MARTRNAVLAALVTSGLCLAAFAAAGARSTEARRREMGSETRLVARQLADQLRNTLEKQMLAVSAVASFFDDASPITESQFQTYAAATLARTPLCLRLAYIDASLHLAWVHPFEPNHGLVGFDVNTHEEGRRVLLRAREAGAASMSPPLRLLDGVRGVVIAAPIVRGTMRGGEATCSVRTDDFFSSVIRPDMLARYDVEARDAEKVAYVSAGFGQESEADLVATERFEVGGAGWTVRVAPSAAVTWHQLHSGQAEFWILGFLAALGLGGLAFAVTRWASATAARASRQGSDLDQVRTRLDDALRQLQQAEKMTAVGELIAGVAHEINNPLATILGYSQLLMRDGVPEEQRRRRLETMHDEAERMARIVRNLLTFARKQPPEKKYLGLNGIIEKTLELKAYHFRMNQVEVRRDLDPDLPRTMLDFHQMQQVILNLLNNAEDAMAEQTGLRVIEVVTRRAGDRIQASFGDSGPGVAAENLAHVFEPFFTTKREGKGTGLGLSLCYGIMQGHGGTIRIGSGSGTGATFVLDLPIVEDRAPLLATPVAAPAGLPALRILVVDDERAMQDLLIDILGANGHRVDTAADVPEASRKIATGVYDVILSDMRMPGGSGRDIHRAAAEKDPALARRIIFTTGDAAAEDTRAFLQECGNDLVLKPFAIDRIEHAIETMLARERARATRAA